MKNGAHNINTLNKNFVKAVTKANKKHVQKKKKKLKSKDNLFYEKKKLAEQQKQKKMLQKGRKSPIFIE